MTPVNSPRGTPGVDGDGGPGVSRAVGEGLRQACQDQPATFYVDTGGDSGDLAVTVAGRRL